MKTYRLNSKGISLVVLIITIIVLVIITSVAILSISGQNGLISQVFTARDDAKKADAKEKIIVAVTASRRKNFELNDDALISNLKKVQGIDLSTVPEFSPIDYDIYLCCDGYDFYVSADGTIGEFRRVDDELLTEVIFNAAGGQCSASPTKKWIGKGNSATKFVKEGEAFGVLPTVNREGYTFIGWTEKNGNTYRDIEYLESNGEQYIMTDYVLKKDDIIETRSLTNAGDSYSTIVASNSAFEIYYTLPSAGAWSHAKMLEGKTTNISKGEICDHKSQLTADATAKMELFAYDGRYRLKGRIYYVRIYRENEMIANFIPIYNVQEKEAGMLETITNTFYKSKGTEKFISGPEMVNSIDENTIFTNDTPKRYYALWQNNQYTVQLDDGTSINNITVTYDTAISVVDIPIKEGYVFGGYYTEPDGKGIQYIDSFGKGSKIWNITKNNTKLYAYWKDTSTIRFYVNGGESLETNTKEVKRGNVIGTLPTPVRTGYTFAGWVYEKLPKEYQEIEYIESDGNPYIKVEQQIQLNDIFRVKSSASSAGTYKTLVAILDYFELYYNLPAIAGWRSITLTSGPTTNLVAGEVYTHEARITANVNTKSLLNIFAYNGSYKLDGKIYYVELIRNNVCIANFIPCYRKSDGAIGMYDIIADQFYTNVGPGAFTKGNDFDDYVTSDMTYTWLGDITLTAKWIEN